MNEDQVGGAGQQTHRVPAPAGVTATESGTGLSEGGREPPRTPTTWVVASGDFQRRGGQDRANYELVRALGKAGRRVEVVGHSAAEELAHLDGVVLNLVSAGPRRVVGDLALEHAAKRIRSSSDSVLLLGNGGNVPGADVVWMHCVHAGWPVQPLEGAPWIKNALGQARKQWARHRETRALNLAQLVIANSDRTVRDVAAHHSVPSARVVRAYLGVDPAFQPPSPAERVTIRTELGLDDSELALCFVGALGWDRNKGLDVALKVLGHLVAFPRRRLFVAGAGDETPWRRIAARIGIAQQVRWCGRDVELPKLFGGCDILLAPSRYDAYGLAVQEAFCAGLPALHSETMGVTERILGLEVLQMSAQATSREWADRVEQIVRSRRVLGDKLARQGELLRASSWEQTSAALVGVIESRLL